MKLTLTTIVLFQLFTFLAQPQQEVYIEAFEPTIEVGNAYALFGNNVVLRSAPSPSSEAIDTLSIGTQVQVIQKMDETMAYRGYNWNWYKVNVLGVNGYIMGGLLSLQSAQTKKTQYFVSVKKNGVRYKVLCRSLQNDSINHIESDLQTHVFSIKAFENRGLKNVQDVLYIDYLAEACGEDGGGIYLFNVDHKLLEAFRTSEVSDGGVFWFHESLTFPEEEDGWDGVVRYTREYAESMDELLDWYEINTTQLSLEWDGEKFTPEIPEMRPIGEE